MFINDSIVRKYLSGQALDSYKDSWIYSGRGFELPNPINKEWVSLLRTKLIAQIQNFSPHNYTLIKKLFPCFDDVAKEYTLMLVVGFPDPYDAMVQSHDGVEYMIFDLIRFGQSALDEGFSCDGILTHELLHICLHKKYPVPKEQSYLENLNYTVFDEGIVHALSYSKNILDLQFDSFLKEKYEQSRAKLRNAVAETDAEKQAAYMITANTGRYWEKFGSVAGMLYALKNIKNITTIYNDGWSGYIKEILGDD